MARANSTRAWQRTLSGRRLDILDPSPVDVELTGYRVLQRVCATCCDSLGDL